MAIHNRRRSAQAQTAVPSVRMTRGTSTPAKPLTAAVTAKPSLDDVEDGALVNATTGPAFFTAPQLAERWGLSTRQIYRFIKAEKLTPTRFGRSLRFSAQEVARFEAGRFGIK